MENYQKKGGEKNDSDARYLKKAKDKLGWIPKTSFHEMVSKMVHNDIELLG